jgi:DNA recombination protein RmuC
MKEIVVVVAGRAVTYGEALIGLGLLGLLVLVWVGMAALRAARERSLEAAVAAERTREIDEKMAELNRLQAETKGSLATVAEVFGARQADLVRLLAERLDGLQHRVGETLATNARATSDNMEKLAERLAVIDTAQKNLAALTSEVVTLKDVLANKQARGAFGQARMEAIVRDALPPSAYAFQATLSNRSRPDCVITLPGDSRPLVVDAKFPLEGFTAFREARDEEGKRAASQRVRTDLATHVKAVASYLLPGETQDMAILFVPAESLYADLQEHFEDVVQKAHRARIMIVSPSLFLMAIQVMQAIVRDQRMREEARVIQTEVGKLLDDVRRLSDRVGRLDQHFRQAQEDVAQIRISSEKIVARGDKIDSLEFDETPQRGRLAAE